jgi:3-oxoadipate enol-lactonase
VVAPDIRGFGKSTYPGGEVSISDFASDILALIQSIGKVPAHVVGISMGGTVALQLALDSPHFAETLILVNTFARLRPDRPSLWFYFALRFILVHTLGLPAQSRAVARRIFPQSGQEELRSELMRQICQADPAGYRAAMRALARFNATSRLGEILIPTLVITGERDTTIPVRIQNELASGIRRAKQITVSEAGHGIIAEQPEAFNRYLLEFLCG